MKYKNSRLVAILDTGYQSYHYEKKKLHQNGYNLSIFNGTREDDKGKISMAKEAEGIFIRQTRINKEFLDNLPFLRVIVRYGIGIDNIDVKACTEKGIKVANVQGYATHSVSDHAIALMFSCLRSLTKGQNEILEHYGKPPVNDIFELHDKTLGIIGLGRIGSMFSMKTYQLFKKILAYDPYINKNKFTTVKAIPSNLNDLLRESHVISIHCSLTNETRNIINKNTIHQMKNNPVLINTARGAVVNERDLLHSLDKGQIHSAGLDVWSEEPPGKEQVRLLQHPRVAGTGHYAWYSDRSSMNLQKRATENMVNLLDGKRCDDLLNG